MFLSSGGEEAAQRVCARIRDVIRIVPQELGLGAWPVTVSIGVAVHIPGQKLEELLRIADRNLYAAKSQGRDQVVYLAA